VKGSIIFLANLGSNYIILFDFSLILFIIIKIYLYIIFTILTNLIKSQLDFYFYKCSNMNFINKGYNDGVTFKT
jgi:hypothetical protein